MLALSLSLRSLLLASAACWAEPWAECQWDFDKALDRRARLGKGEERNCRMALAAISEGFRNLLSAPSF